MGQTVRLPDRIDAMSDFPCHFNRPFQAGKADIVVYWLNRARKRTRPESLQDGDFSPTKATLDEVSRGFEAFPP